MKSKLYIISSLIMLFVFSQTAIADPHHNKNQSYSNGYSDYFNSSGKKHHYKHGKHHGNHHDNSWYKDNKGGATIDLVYAGISAILASQYAKEANVHSYHALPPGIRKNLARGKPLPPGIAKKMVPSSLLGRLPRHHGYEWRISGRDLILLSMTNSIVADVLYDVFD